MLVLDEPDAIRKKFGSAVTDSGREVVRGAGQARDHQPDRHPRRRPRHRPGGGRAEFEGAGYGDFKKAVAEAVVELLAPVRERYAELRPDEAALEATSPPAPRRRARSPPPTLADVREPHGHRPA